MVSPETEMLNGKNKDASKPQHQQEVIEKHGCFSCFQANNNGYEEIQGQQAFNYRYCGNTACFIKSFFKAILYLQDVKFWRPDERTFSSTQSLHYSKTIM